MTDPVNLSTDQRVALEAVTAIEAEGGTASIQRVADRAGLEVDHAASALSELATTHDLVREIDVAQHDDATGVGRAYVTKAEPAPR